MSVEPPFDFATWSRDVADSFRRIFDGAVFREQAEKIRAAVAKIDEMFRVEREAKKDGGRRMRAARTWPRPVARRIVSRPLPLAWSVSLLAFS